MTRYEENLLNAQDEDRVVFYDYNVYRKRAKALNGVANIQRAIYNADFLESLPNYYFLGLPIKELLKEYFSNGSCHLCAVALSLCFDECEIITCNLDNYALYLGCERYEHSVILVKLNGEEKIIDSTFCLITDLETYRDIFSPNDIRVLRKEEIEGVSVYRLLDSLKDSYIAPPDEDVGLRKKEPTLVEKKYQELLKYYDELCLSYSNDDNPHLTDFIRRCLIRNAGSFVQKSLRGSLQYNSFDYPKNNLCSLEDSDLLVDEASKKME